jgi:hypothetical protein
MPRKTRVEYPGAIYHLMSRGDRKEAIYHNDVDLRIPMISDTCSDSIRTVFRD